VAKEEFLLKERLASNASFYKIIVFDIGAWLYTQIPRFLRCRTAVLICGLAVAQNIFAILLLLMWLEEFNLVQRVEPGLKLIAREAGLPRDRCPETGLPDEDVRMNRV
jgi:hypothetical protein